MWLPHTYRYIENVYPYKLVGYIRSYLLCMYIYLYLFRIVFIVKSFFWHSICPSVVSACHANNATYTYMYANMSWLKLICLFLWHTQCKDFSSRETDINLYRCGPKSIHRNFISDSLLFCSALFVFHMFSFPSKKQCKLPGSRIVIEFLAWTRHQQNSLNSLFRLCARNVFWQGE